ncbi:MAG: ABC transporter substrate-binding protein [Alphaproteobacteria bacterium]|nr:ABC transporter substrate-binding protein [Alphaproteobacteria bacterium]
MATTQDPIPFRVGMTSPANTFLAIWMAEAEGLYDAQGLAVEIVDMVGGSETGPALTEGRVHLMHIGLSSVVRANALGADVRAIGSLSNVVRSALFTAPGIDKPEDLKGGTVGISSVGSESDATTTLALGKLGLSRDDVTFKEIGVQRLAPVRTGAVTATMLGEPYRSAALAEGLTPIVDLLAERIPWLYSGLVMDKRYLDANLESATRFFRATVEANYRAIADAGRAKQVLGDALAITDAGILDLAYANFRASSPPNAKPSHEAAANVIATVAAPGASHVLGDYVDDRVYDGLAAAGFFKQMAETYRVA